MTATIITQTEPLSPKGVKLYKIAGWSILGICLLHLVFWSVISLQSWLPWVTGAFWSAEFPPNNTDTLTLSFHFWALPGSFMVPLFLLSLLILRAARYSNRLPAYVGWILLIWVLICSLILMPSGFLLFIIPCILLIWANKRNNG